MEYIFFVSYSCYQSRMRILLNGKESLSASSTMLQYMNEPFYTWAHKFLDLLYREIEEDYALIFVGRTEETEIIAQLANTYLHCKSFEARKPIIDTSVKERMVGLSKLIKENTFQIPPPISMNAVFLSKEENVDIWKTYVNELEICNQYCNVSFSSDIIENYGTVKNDSVVFYIFDSIEEAEKHANNVDLSKYAFFLIEGQSTGFIQLLDNKYFFGFTKDIFFDIVFHCFFLFPLVESFSKYARILLKKVSDENMRTKIKLLLSEKPVIEINAESTIELDRSVPFDIRVFPKGAQIPELYFEYQLPDIVECAQQRVYGKKEGISKVLIYEKGEVEPLKELCFTVKRRNRVTTVNLSDYSLSLGVGDRHTLEMEIFPENADNLDKIKWYSDDEKIADVDQDGCVYIKSVGKCNIYCSVDKVFSSCTVESKPYLRDIKLADDFLSGNLSMQFGEEKNLNINLVPEDAYDKEVNISSSDYMVINIKNDTVVACGIGEADIYIENSTKRIRKRIHITVYSNSIKSKMKKSFFGLFRKGDK